MIKNTERPRFIFYLEKVEGRKVLTMPKRDWDKIPTHYGDPVKIDIMQIPMSAVKSNATIIAVTATRFTDKPSMVDIYREDKRDPKPINKDTYIVLENIVNHSDYHKIVIAASTNDNQNLRNYLNKNVFLIKKDQTEDHWLSELPLNVKSIIEKST